MEFDSNKQGIYKEFYGRNIDQIPLLISEGRVPMNTSQLMQKRLNGISELEVISEDFSKGIEDFWGSRGFNTFDVVIYNLNRDIKIVLDYQPLKEINPQTQRKCGGLTISEDFYKTLEGEVLNKDNIGKINMPLTKEEAKVNPVWKVLARDQALLNDYVDFVFSKRKRFLYYTGMSVCLNDFSSKKLPEIRLWTISGIEFGADALGFGSIDYDFGRFMGILDKEKSKTYNNSKL
jgi:hypothetical protein